VRKMSKSMGNYVALTDPPEEMFGKLMRIPDELIVHYLQLCTGLDQAAVERLERGLADGSLHAGEAKRRMARDIVDIYYGPDGAAAAEERFDLVHREHGIPEDVPTTEIPAEAVRDGRVWLPRLLTALDMAGSNAEARRLISQGAVRIDGDAVTDPDLEMETEGVAGRVIQVGRRRFVRLSG
jgi:tyrosyl-tRNA synthetase